MLSFACCSIFLSAFLLAGCATTFDNLPLNRPITLEFIASINAPRDIVDENVIALSLSGGGMRAAAFSYGVMEALRDIKGDKRTDVFDDLTFITSVSGGSLAGAYFALHGRRGFDDFRTKVLDRDLERDLRMSLFSFGNLSRLFAGGLNDRSNLTQTLNSEVFGRATFADLYRKGKPDVWINASDLYNRTPFPFTPGVFMSLCSDLSRFSVAEAVAASMAVPLVFSPVMLQTYPDQCLNELPLWTQRGTPRAGQGVLGAVASAVRNYRDPQRMRYVKLADGGLTDNYGLSSILIARAASGNAHGPFTEAEAVRLRRMLFLVVDAGRPPSGDWAKSVEGPSGVDVGLAAADTAIDAAARLSADAFKAMVEEWRESIVRFRCSLADETVRRHLKSTTNWNCSDVRFYVEVIGFESLEDDRADKLKVMPTRLALARSDVETAVSAGRDATRSNDIVQRYVRERFRRDDE
jgi:NTE family protein